MPLAFILAAGRGERMRPLTDLCPKPLLEVGGKPLIVWHIEKLAAAGFDRLVINTSWLGAQIAEALGDGRRFGAAIAYSHEPTALETAGGIANALPLIDGPAFALVSADLYCDLDYSRLAMAVDRLANAAPADSHLGHLVMVPTPAHRIVWDASLAGGRVVASGQPRYTYAGLGAFRREPFTAVTVGTQVPLRDLLDPMIANQTLTGESYTGYWADVGTPERLAEVNRHLNSTATLR